MKSVCKLNAECSHAVPVLELVVGEGEYGDVSVGKQVASGGVMTDTLAPGVEVVAIVLDGDALFFPIEICAKRLSICRSAADEASV